MNEKLKALIDALAGLGIKVPENTTFEGIIAIVKQNKKLLKAHDAVVQAQTEGPSSEEDDEETPTEEEDKKVDDPVKEEETPEEKPKEEPKKEETSPNLPNKKVITPETKEEDKPIKNKFVQQR